MAKLAARLHRGRRALHRLVERKAFDSYMRHGFVPNALSMLAATASDEQKFIDLCEGLTVKALANGKATTHYTWRTARDDRVRDAHAALDGQVISWSTPPDEGHPGIAPNCRCWAEPYFGNPAVPDELLQLVLEREVSTNPSQLWASIERLTRPDASIAASSIDLVDGSKIVSTFRGPSVSQLVSFPDANSLLSLRMGETREVSVQRDGETVLRVAQMRRILMPDLFPPLPAPTFGPPAGSDKLAKPSLLEMSASPWAVVLRGALALYNTAIAAPEPMGLGVEDLAVVAIKIWHGDTAGGAVTITSEVLTAEQVAQTCRRLPTVQEWTNMAAAKLSAARLSMSAQQFGTALHTSVHHTVQDLKFKFPLEYSDLFSELSISFEGLTSVDREGPYYGEAGTTRLDIFERVDATTACVYDIKSGRKGLAAIRVEDFVQRVAKMSGITTVIVVQVGIE